MIEMTEAMKKAHIETAKRLQGAERRQYMGRIVLALGRGGQRFAQRELGWNRATIRKGMREVQSGFEWIDNFQARGRKAAEEHLPNLLDDIRDVVDGQSQTDPTFQSVRLYCHMSAREVRQQLIEEKKYKDKELPVERTLRKKLNQLGYTLKRVQKTKPKKNT